MVSRRAVECFSKLRRQMGSQRPKSSTMQSIGFKHPFSGIQMYDEYRLLLFGRVMSQATVSMLHTRSFWMKCASLPTC